MVIFRTSEGKPAYHQTEAVEEAVRFVEHLRNEEQVTDARVFTMTEVPLEFKVHWRVEVSAPAPEPVAPFVEPAAAASFFEEPAPFGDEPSPEEDAVPVPVGATEDEADIEAVLPAPSSASSRFGLFNRNS
jgi:hypothetical protein